MSGATATLARLWFTDARRSKPWSLFITGPWSGHQRLGFARRVDAIAFAARRGIRLEET